MQYIHKCKFGNYRFTISASPFCPVKSTELDSTKFTHQAYTMAIFTKYFSIVALSCKLKNLLSPKKFRQINRLAISLVKPLLSRNFCQKTVRINIRNFLTVCVHCTVFTEIMRKNGVSTIKTFL